MSTVLLSRGAGARSRLRFGNNTSNEETHGVLGLGPVRTPRGHKESPGMRKEDLSPLDIQSESPNWTQEELILEIPNKILKRTNWKGSGKRAQFVLGLGQKFRKKSEMDVFPGEGNVLRNGIKLPNTFGRSKSNQE